MEKCCDIKTRKDAVSVCPSCSKKGKKVPLITLVQLVKRKYQDYIQKDHQYYFCDGQECDVVYYSPGDDHVFKKESIRVRVGQKETQDPVHLCYCFDYTKADIVRELKDTGKCTITEDITQKIKDGLCACEIRNPQGSCCLGNIKAAIRALKK